MKRNAFLMGLLVWWMGSALALGQATEQDVTSEGLDGIRFVPLKVSVNGDQSLHVNPRTEEFLTLVGKVVIPASVKAMGACVYLDEAIDEKGKDQLSIARRKITDLAAQGVVLPLNLYFFNRNGSDFAVAPMRHMQTLALDSIPERIQSLRGRILVVVADRMTVVALDATKSAEFKPIVPGFEVRVDELQKGDHGDFLTVTSSTTHAERTQYGVGPPFLGLLELRDQDDKPIASMCNQVAPELALRQGHGIVNKIEIHPNLRLGQKVTKVLVSAVTRVEEKVVPFEVKNLELPPMGGVLPLDAEMKPLVVDGCSLLLTSIQCQMGPNVWKDGNDYHASAKVLVKALADPAVVGLSAQSQLLEAIDDTGKNILGDNINSVGGIAPYQCSYRRMEHQGQNGDATLFSYTLNLDSVPQRIEKLHGQVWLMRIGSESSKDLNMGDMHKDFQAVVPGFEMKVESLDNAHGTELKVSYRHSVAVDARWNNGLAPPFLRGMDLLDQEGKPIEMAMGVLDPSGVDGSVQISVYPRKGQKLTILRAHVVTQVQEKKLEFNLNGIPLNRNKGMASDV